MQQRPALSPSKNDPFVINLNDPAAMDNTTADDLYYNNKTRARNTLRFRSYSSFTPVHCIPFVLFLCFLILWFFSYSVEKKSKGAADFLKIHHVLLSSSSLSNDLAAKAPATAPEFLNLTTGK